MPFLYIYLYFAYIFIYGILHKECILYTRSALTEFVSIQNIKRDNLNFLFARSESILTQKITRSRFMLCLKRSANDFARFA
jgi:hypothetical protein